MQGHSNRHGNGHKNVSGHGIRNEHDTSDNKPATSHDGPQQESEGIPRGGFRLRLRHFTWQFFTICMATSGISNVLWNGRSVVDMCNQ